MKRIARIFRALGMAMGLYTALPGFAGWDDDCTGYLAAMLPAVGLILGGLWYGLVRLCGLFMPSLLLAALMAMTIPLLSGFLHLDGFMDVSDALLSRRPREDMLRILKDPHTGAFAVISLVCWFLVMFAASAGLVMEGRQLEPLILLPAASRAMAGMAIMGIKPIAQSSYGRMNYDTASAAKRVACLVCLLMSIAAACFMSWQAAVSLAAAAIAFAAATASAVRALGGMNGDVSGCAICVSEAAGLIVLACL